MSWHSSLYLWLFYLPWRQLGFLECQKATYCFLFKLWVWVLCPCSYYRWTSLAHTSPSWPSNFPSIAASSLMWQQKCDFFELQPRLSQTGQACWVRLPLSSWTCCCWQTSHPICALLLTGCWYLHQKCDSASLSIFSLQAPRLFKSDAQLAGGCWGSSALI